MRLLITMLAFALPLAACAPPSQTITTTSPAPVRVEGALRAGWADSPGPPGTGCAGDSTYKLVVHPGASDRVLLFLKGGGACWRAAECNPRGRVTYTTRADSANDPRVQGGVFALDSPANPLRDFTMVYVPYCTGDVHLGTRTVTYTMPAGANGATAPVSFAIRHQGAANAEWAVRWIRDHVSDPGVIIVAGSSGGAIPSPVFAEKLALHYRGARVVQLGDAAGGYQTPTAPALLAGWGYRRDEGKRFR